jgi:hypothetical protein
MKNYIWVCHSCKQTNEADADCCSECACPKNATLEEMQAHGMHEDSKRHELIEPMELVLVMVLAITFLLFDYLPKLILFFLTLGTIIGGIAMVNRRWKRFFKKDKS